MKNKGQVIIYQTEDGQFEVNVTLTDDTVWLSQKQMAQLFDIERSVITKHINNIFKQKELEKESVCANFAHTAEDGKIYQTTFYNLDVIIAVGYRVNAKRGTQFRIWATRTLKEHLLKGYSLNQKKLAETGVKELENALQFIKQASSRRHLTHEEAQGLLDVIGKYAKSWLLLKSYDEHTLPVTKGHSPKFMLSYDCAKDAIAKLKAALIEKGEAANIFGHEREQGLEAILGNLAQSFGGEDLYPSLEGKAAHLLYFIIKDHPFLDGNKRIASLLFIHYLDQNKRLYKANGEAVINDNALVATALLIAESEPKNKELMISLIENLLNDGLKQ
jgi:prophage maintenance system killer protein/plasmid maintenance system antidote protein VapI